MNLRSNRNWKQTTENLQLYVILLKWKVFFIYLSIIYFYMFGVLYQIVNLNFYFDQKQNAELNEPLNLNNFYESFKLF